MNFERCKREEGVFDRQDLHVGFKEPFLLNKKGLHTCYRFPQAIG